MKLLPLFLLLFLSSFISAQQLFPSPGLIYGTVYYFNQYDAPVGTWTQASIKYDQDTMVCGENLHRFRSKTDHSKFYQEEDGQYFRVNPTGPCPLSKKTLLYDFTGEVGDTLYGNAPSATYISVVLLKDTVTLSDGKPRRRLILKNTEWPIEEHEIIEGIGSTKYGFDHSAYSLHGEHYELICVQDSSGVLYSNTDADTAITCASTTCFDPIPSFSFLCNGNEFTFENHSTFAASYHWDFGDGHTSFEMNPVHEYTDEGCYTVTLSAYTNCQPDPQVNKQICNVGGHHYWVPPAELPFTFRQAFVRTNEHWSLVEGKTIHTTHDAGQSWYVYTLPDSFANAMGDIQDIYFSSETHGILGGQAQYNTSISEGLTSVFMTKNGGESWMPVFVPDPDDISKVLQVNEDVNYLGGTYPEPIYMTQNGGDSWNAIEGVNASRISDICAPSNELLYYCGRVSYDVQFGVIQNGEVILAKEISLGDQYSGEIPNALFFLDPLTGWIITSRRVLSTTNGGLDWSIHKLNATGMKDIHFENKDHGLIIGDHGLILESFNGGLTWDSTYCDQKDYLWYSELFWPENTNPFIIGTGEILQLSNMPKKEDCQTVAIEPVLPQPQKMRLFPNPVGDSRLVQVHYPKMEGGELHLYSTSGQLVHQQIIPPSDQLLLDCSLLTSGFYVIRLTTSVGHMLIDKLIIH